jgi:hypothetical protein
VKHGHPGTFAVQTESAAPARRFVFIGGLHRSGTTMIARALAAHPSISGFRNTGAIEDEGQFLQTVFPVENEFGGAGRFGFDPRAHMTEASALNSARNAASLLGDWGRHWDCTKPVLLEKTPSNLLRMRLLQALVPPSYFIIVMRHPIAACLATSKWTEGNLFSLLTHWVHCYSLACEDAKLIDRVLWVSYENFVADPSGQLARMAEFLDLSPDPHGRPEVRNENGRYFDLWRTQFFADGMREIEQVAPERPRSLMTRLRDKWTREARERALPSHRRRANLRNFYDAQDAVAFLEPAINRFGYSFLDLSRSAVNDEPSEIVHKSRQ